MTNLELFTALGDISTENLLGAEEVQSRPGVRTNGKRKRKQAVLVSAVIALTLLLVGCAVAAYARIHMKLVRHNPASTIQTSTEAAGNTGSARNVLTDCYPQTLPEGYLPGDGAPANHTTRRICYYNAEGQTIHYSISTNLEPDLVLAPPCEETSMKVSGWDAELHLSARGAQMLKWHNTEDGYYGCLFTQDMSVDLKPMAESVDYGEPLPVSFLCKQGQLWDVWYPQQIPEGYACTDVSPAENGTQSICYTCSTENVISYSVSLISNLSDLSDPLQDSCIWEELTVSGQPAKMMTTGSGQRLLYWKNEEEGFNAVLSAEDEAVDIVAMAESVTPGEPLEVSANYLGPDYTVELEQESSACVEWEMVYPQNVPEGYTIRFVGDPAYGEQSIDYSNDTGDSLRYTLYFRLGQWGRQFDGMGQPEQVDINGQTGYRIGNTLIWTDETRRFGFALRSSADIDLIAIAKSVAPGPELTPTNADKTEKALEQLGDYQITALPKGMVEDGLTGCPLEDGGGWYSYVCRWYFNKKTNQELYFTYESYVSDAASVEEVVQMNIGNTPAEFQTVLGCAGATAQVGSDAEVVWIQGSEAKGVSFTLISPNYSVEELLEIAESVQMQ